MLGRSIFRVIFRRPADPHANPPAAADESISSHFVPTGKRTLVCVVHLTTPQDQPTCCLLARQFRRSMAFRLTLPDPNSCLGSLGRPITTSRRAHFHRSTLRAAHFDGFMAPGWHEPPRAKPVFQHPHLPCIETVEVLAAR